EVAPDLDALLAEYEPPKVAAEVEAPAAPTSAEVLEMRTMLQQNRETQLEEGLNESARMVKEAAGETANNVPEWMIKGALREEAIRNPQIEQVFNDRKANPAAWTKVASALGKKIATDLSVDQAATDSWNAVDSAQNSASSGKVQGKELDWTEKGMSDSEFTLEKMKLANS
ncbi:unnamed protein product, partial [marine sediment metagenome]